MHVRCLHLVSVEHRRDVIGEKRVDALRQLRRYGKAQGEPITLVEEGAGGEALH